MAAFAPTSCLVSAPKFGRRSGYSRLISEGESFGERTRSLMDFDLLRLSDGKTLKETTVKETLWVLMEGKARVRVGEQTCEVARKWLFEEGPSVVHVGIGERVEISALAGGCEWAVVRTANLRKMAPRVYRENEFASEDRGAGLAQGACRRLVRTVFDYTTRPESNLVLGEVINYAGRWSSYPPHHHPQPEIYHYRFTLPQGYGHAELGKDVLRVRNGDTIKIPGGLDHAQVSAPGYGMYYLWVVRHLPRKPYKGFTFTQAHTWLLDPAQQGWKPTQLPSP